MEINNTLYNKLKSIGIIDSDVRKDNIGNSDYSKHIIQPWSIWKDYNLNPWDADIVKRVLRTKEEPGKSKEDARIMDYEKIIHICKERIRQINEDKKEEGTSSGISTDGTACISKFKPSAISYSLNEKEANAYAEFQKQHYELHKGIKACGCSVTFTHSGIGVGKSVKCNVCKESKNITDYNTW